MPHSESETRSAILVFTDLVGSTDLKVRHGVPAYSAALKVHNDHFERLAGECRGVRILQNMGDGYFAEADSVSEAVRFALLFQDAMRMGPWGEVHLATRVGINAGEVSALKTEGGSGIVGPAVDLASRVMGLAVGGQILLTQFPFDEARPFLREHPSLPDRQTPPLRWLAHGPYLFKGRADPVEIFEVGAEGVAPLTPPPDGEKAKRAIRPGDEETLGWRPAVGLEIPGRSGWRLVNRLGAGGFGEVWTGEHAKLRQRRAFKFCFDEERLRALKREATLVRLLRTALGDRDDIVRLHELKLDEPPFYLESDLAPHGNLLQWAEKQGGLAAIPLAQRIALVAYTAKALAAAHSVGVLHKDIKPTNILIFDAPDGSVRPRLVDFGIGTLADPRVLAQLGVTAAGFTRLTAEHNTGTPAYSPPEYLAGKPYTVQGDIYGLGVVLYQLLTADSSRPIAPGWERDITDPLLREDIAACVDGDPARRLPSATDLTERLLNLDQRRAEEAEKERLAREAAARTEAEAAAAVARLRAARSRKLAAAFAGLALLAAAGGLFGWRGKREAEQKRLEANKNWALAQTNWALAQAHLDNATNVLAFLNEMFASANPESGNGADFTVRQLLEEQASRVETQFRERPAIRATLLLTIGKAYDGLDLKELARKTLEAALDAKTNAFSAPDIERAEIMGLLATLLPPAESRAMWDRALITLKEAGGPSNLLAVASADRAAIHFHTHNMEKLEEEFYNGLSLLGKSPKQLREEIERTVAEGGQLLGSGDQSGAIALVSNYCAPYLLIPVARANVPGTLSMIAVHQDLRGDTNGAEALFKTGIAIGRDVLGTNNPNFASQAYAPFGDRLRKWGRYEEAETCYREALSICERLSGPRHIGAFYLRVGLAESLLAQKKVKEAAVVLNTGLFKDQEGHGWLILTVYLDAPLVAGILCTNALHVNVRDPSGLLAIHLAAEKDRNEILKSFIGAGIDVEAVSTNGNAPLHFAAKGNSTNAIRLLAKHGARIDAKGDKGMTPLMVAAQNGRIDALKLLIELGADVGASNLDGDTALSLAAKRGSLPVAQALIVRGVDVGSTDKDGFTPLHFAASAGLSDVAILLLRNNAGKARAGAALVMDARQQDP